MRRHYINPGALIEAVISLLFGLKLFWMAYTGQYLLFVTPRMKGYLYFAALVMAVWAFSSFARTGIPEYRQHLNRTLVLLIPLMALQLPYQALGASGNMSYSSQGLVQAGRPREESGQNEKTDKQAVSGESEAAVTQAADMYTGSSDDGTESLEETQGGNIDETAGAQEDSERIETPPGLDTENRRIVVDDASFYPWLVQLSYYPEMYEGYEIQMHGTVYRDDTLTVGQFGLIRMLMSCCVADLQPCGPLCIWDQAETLSQDEWVTVTGTYHYDEEKGMEIQVLKVEKAEAAEDEYVYPVY